MEENTTRRLLPHNSVTGAHFIFKAQIFSSSTTAGYGINSARKNRYGTVVLFV